MVTPSLGLPTVYVAEELEIAIDAALKKHEAELREMKMKKQEIQELSKRQWFGLSDAFITYKILKNAEYLTSAFELK